MTLGDIFGKMKNIRFRTLVGAYATLFIVALLGALGVVFVQMFLYNPPIFMLGAFIITGFLACIYMID